VFWLRITYYQVSASEHASHILFLCNWALCYHTFARYKAVRKAHYVDGEPRVIHTGDLDTGDREPTMAMKVDVLATAVVLLSMGLDFAVRIYPAIVREGGIGATQGSDLYMLWVQILTVLLSLSALPWLIFKLPGIGSLVHGLRPTGYDKSGTLRLEMTLDHARKKYDAEQRALKGASSPYEVLLNVSSPITNLRSPRLWRNSNDRDSGRSSIASASSPVTPRPDPRDRAASVQDLV
jgi:hypothetical protein